MKRKRTLIAWPEPVDWKQTSDHQWTVPGNEEERHTRIKRLTNRWLDLDYDSFHTYRRGQLVGVFKSLKEAKRRAGRFLGNKDNGLHRT